MFQLPVKEIIVNDDSQVRLLNGADGVAYSGTTNLTPTTGSFILEGFLGPVSSTQVQLLSGTTRIRKTTFSTGAAEVVTFTITAAAGGKAGDTYRIVTDSLDLTPTEYQNRPTEKRYQLSVDCGTADAIKTELIARIAADPSSQVTAASGGTGIVTLTAKKVGVSVRAYVGEYSVVGQTTYSVTGVNAVTTASALPVGTYDALKNINWAKNFSIDQNINWMPLPGAQYETYYFEVNGSVPATLGNNPIPNELHNGTRFAVRLYVKNSLTLETTLDHLVTDLNV